MKFVSSSYNEPIEDINYDLYNTKGQKVTDVIVNSDSVSFVLNELTGDMLVCDATKKIEDNDHIVAFAINPFPKHLY